MTPEAPASTAARVASSASTPSSSSCSCAIGRVPDGPPAQGAGQPLAPERPPDAARGDGDDEGQHGQQGDGDHDGHDEARGPRGVVGALERGLLAGRTEDPAEAVDDELDAQQERDHGQRQRRGPEVAAQPPVQDARGDEAPRQPRVVQALHARSARAGRRWARRQWGVAVGPERAGADEHGAVPAPVSHARSTAVAHGHAATFERLARARASRSEGAITTITWESARAANVTRARSVRSRMMVHGAGGVVGAPRGHQPSADDHDARPLPFARAAGRCHGRRPASCRWARAGGGGRRRPRPAGRGADGERRGRTAAVAAASPLLPPFRRRLPFAVHRVTFGGPGPSAMRRIASPGVQATPVRLRIRARDQARGRPDQLDRGTPTARAPPPRRAGRRVRHRRRPLRRRRPPALPRAGQAGLDGLLRGLRGRSRH